VQAAIKRIVDTLEEKNDSEHFFPRVEKIVGVALLAKVPGSPAS
jgi:hypothetical protein